MNSAQTETKAGTCFISISHARWVCHHSFPAAVPAQQASNLWKSVSLSPCEQQDGRLFTFPQRRTMSSAGGEESQAATHRNLWQTSVNRSVPSIKCEMNADFSPVALKQFTISTSQLKDHYWILPELSTTSNNLLRKLRCVWDYSVEWIV